MKTELFDFEFDERLISTEPLSNRLDAKLMVIGNHNDLEHRHIANLPEFINDNDVIILNNTKVIKARLSAKITTEGRSAHCEITLHKLIKTDHHNKITYSAFVRGAKKLRVNDTISFEAPDGQIVTANIINKIESDVFIEFDLSSITELFDFVEKAGSMPLPPYITSKRKADASDDVNYQTVFAKNPGSVAAPTASLHLSHTLLDQLQKRNITIAYVTLHVGGGTFLPVKSDTIYDHQMHSEIIMIDQENADLINKAKQNGGRIICVGTTALRVIESVSTPTGKIEPYVGETDIFIYPGYQFKACDLLLTNFHLPKSTLFMLVCAFSGLEVMQNAYQIAQEKNYRFFSYGDACLLYRKGLNQS